MPPQINNRLASDGGSVYTEANMAQKVSKMDGEFAKLAEEILIDTDKVPTRVQVSLILAMVNQIHRGVGNVTDGINGVIDRQDAANGRTTKLENEIIELKKKNIVNWIALNPKSAILWLLVSFFALETLAHEFTSVENVAFIWGVVRKWLGI